MRIIVTVPSIILPIILQTDIISYNYSNVNNEDDEYYQLNKNAICAGFLFKEIQNLENMEILKQVNVGIILKTECLDYINISHIYPHIKSFLRREKRKSFKKIINSILKVMKYLSSFLRRYEKIPKDHPDYHLMHPWSWFPSHAILIKDDICFSKYIVGVYTFSAEAAELCRNNNIRLFNNINDIF